MSVHVGILLVASRSSTVFSAVDAFLDPSGFIQKHAHKPSGKLATLNIQINRETARTRYFFRLSSHTCILHLLLQTQIDIDHLAISL